MPSFLSYAAFTRFSAIQEASLRRKIYKVLLPITQQFMKNERILKVYANLVTVFDEILSIFSFLPAQFII